MKRRLFCLILCLCMVLAVPTQTVFATETTTEESTEESSGSDGSWVRFQVDQTGNPQFFHSGCTCCSLINIFQNSGLVLDEDYKVADGRYGGAFKGKDGFSGSDYDNFMNCVEIVNAKGRTLTDISCWGWGTASALFNEHTDATWEMVGTEGDVKEATTYTFTVGLNGKDFKDMTHDELVQAMQVFWNNGYWIVAGINYDNDTTGGTPAPTGYGGQHWMMLSGVTDNEIYFNDSVGAKTVPLTGYYDGGVDIVHIVLLKNDKISLKDAAGGKNAGSSDGSNDLGIDENVFLGLDPDGLSTYCTLKEADLSSMFQEATLDNLTNQELTGLENWKDNKKANEEGFISIGRKFTILAGIIMILYAVLLYLGYWFDKINVYFDLDVVGILTFKKLKITDNEEECTFSLTDQPKSEARTINHKYLVMICVMLIGFGVLLISGMMFVLVSAIVSFVRNLFG